MLRVVEQAAFTDTGRQRRANEDAMLARAPLYAVADGMGGARAGEIASRTAIDILGLGVEDGIVRSRIVELVRRANRAVHEAQLSDPDLSGMGTTTTVAHVGGEALTVAHVGDSRAYLLRDGSLRRLTDDHSLVEEMRRSGRLTAEEARTTRSARSSRARSGPIRTSRSTCASSPSRPATSCCSAPTGSPR